ncbi:MAG: sulfatase-like hydrolase/transferase [Planctomycetales bacterium]|nr:sulfatase-like hydrolase/transferase [Planctomycetales bacterium]
MPFLTRLVVALWFVGGGQLAECNLLANETRPNILLVTADNLGYGDLACFNKASEILAPNFDRLAAEGAKLTQFYTASPTCTVSRACLLTGRIPQRHGLTQQLPGIEGNYGQGLNPEEILISQVLRSAGYATGCFGKWNIGFAAGSRPTERGFDEFFGHASGNIDYYTHNYNRKHDLYRGTDEVHVEGYSTDLFADAAIKFIRRHRHRPWFVYLPFNAPHFPNAKNKAPGEEVVWQAPDSAFEQYGYDRKTRNEQQRYRAVVTALDSALGRLLDALDLLNESEETFVFFASDNGAFMLENRGLEVATNTPLREGGVTCWEGGIRVAALARWPKQIAAGSEIQAPLWTPDLMIACARLAGVSLPQGLVLDGRDPLPVLTGEAELPYRSLFFEYQEHAALRMGSWKILRTRPSEAWQLFNLDEDIGESNDLSQAEPQRLAELVDEFRTWTESTY